MACKVVSDRGDGDGRGDGSGEGPGISHGQSLMLDGGDSVEHCISGSGCMFESSRD